MDGRRMVMDRWHLPNEGIPMEPLPEIVGDWERDNICPICGHLLMETDDNTFECDMCGFDTVD